MTVYKHAFTGTLPAGDVFSFGWHDSNSIGLGASHTLATAWINDLWSGVLLTPGIGTVMEPGVVVTKVTTYALDALVPYHTTAIAATDLALPGGSAADSLPQDLAVVVSMRTATPGRRGRGRIYLPAPNTTVLTAVGEFSAAGQTLFNNALHAAWNDANVGGVVPVIFSRLTGAITPVTNFGIGTVFDHQVRRVNKVNTVRAFLPMP